jgi:hypothetical protein
MRVGRIEDGTTHTHHRAKASGVEAASATRKKDRTAEIRSSHRKKQLVTADAAYPLSSGHIANFKDLVVYPPAFFQMLKLNLRTETRPSQ